MTDGAIVYRHPTARATTVVGIAAIVVAVGAGMFVPSGDFTALAPLVAAAAWIAWVLWAYPFVRLDERAILVRNSFTTVEIPLTAVAEVSGGAKLTIRTVDRRTYIPAAAPGSGGSFMWRALRAKETYADSIVPVKGVEVLRLDASRERTPASVIAQTISRRLDLLGPRAEGPRAVPPPRINVDIVLITIGVLVAAAALFAVLV